MERHVGGDEGFGLAERRALPLQDDAQIGDVLRRGLFRCHPRHATLEEDAGILQVFQRIGGFRQHDLGGEIHLPEQRFRRQFQHLGALAVGNRHQPHIGKRLHRLADRRPSDAEPFHQFALGRHLVAGLQFA